MSDMITLAGLMRSHTRGKTRILMSMRGALPVLCSHVTHDTHFFEEDTDCLEQQLEAALAIEEADIIIPECLKTARATSEGFIVLGEDDGLPLTDEAADFCRSAFAVQPATDIEAALALLNHSATGQMLAAQDVIFTITSAISGARYDATRDTLLINPYLTVEQAVLMIAREMRHKMLQPVKPLLSHPDRAVLLNRAIQAELNGIMIQVAWELSLAGYNGAWTCVSESALADQAFAFGHRASEDFRALRDGRSAIAAFDQWFYSGRTRKADRALIQSLLAQQAHKDNLPVFSISETIEALRLIGDRGLGRNYLLDHMATLLEDGFYGEVRDRSNANFLWFVKFERSYRAAEEAVEAQKQSAPQAQDTGSVLAFPDIMRKTRKGKARKAQAEILPLPAQFMN